MSHPALASLDDDAVRAALTRIKGIGPWTADLYLLMAGGLIAQSRRVC